MIQLPTDLELAKTLLPATAAKKDTASADKIQAAADSISEYCEPTRKALANLAGKLQMMQDHPDFKQAWKSAAQSGFNYAGPTWKLELAEALAIVNEFPVGSPMG